MINAFLNKVKYINPKFNGIMNMAKDNQQLINRISNAIKN